MGDTLVKKLVDVTQSMTSKLDETEQRVDAFDKTLTQAKGELREAVGKIQASESKHSKELNELKANLEDKLGKFQAMADALDNQVAASVSKGITKGTQEMRSDIDALRRDVSKDVSDISKTASDTLRKITAGLDELENETAKKDVQITERLEKELAAALTSLVKKIDAAMNEMEKAADERRASLSDSVQNALTDNSRIIDDLSAKVESLNNFIAMQEGGLKKHVSAEMRHASTAMQTQMGSALESAVSKAKASLDKEVETDRMETARRGEEYKKRLADFEDKLNGLLATVRDANAEFAAKLDELKRSSLKRDAAIESNILETVNAKMLKEAANFKQINDSMAALIKDVNAEKEALRTGIGSIVNQQLDEQKVFERIDAKTEYLENVIDMQNKGFDEKLSKEVQRAIVDSTVSVQKKFQAIDEQLRTLESYADSKSHDVETRLTETLEALRKELTSSSESARSYVSALDSRYNRNFDSLEKSVREQLDDVRDSTSDALSSAAREYREAIAEMRKRVDALDNIMDIEEKAEDKLRSDVRAQLDQSRNELKGALEEMKKEVKTRTEQLRTSIEPMVTQRVESRAHAIETRLDEKYGSVQRNLKENVKEILVSDAEALATAKVENVLFAMTEELERKKREIENEIDKIQTRAVSSVDDVRRQIEADVQRVHTDIEANARTLRGELEDVQSMKARLAADLEKMGNVDVSELLTRIARLENEIASMRRQPSFGRTPIILE